MNTPPFALGIDLGGTNVRAGLVDSTGQLLSFESRPIDPRASGPALVSQITRLAHDLPLLSDARGAGLALAGAVLPGKGIQGGLVNLPRLDGFPLKEEVEQALGMPCQLDNDATLALLGECRYGAGRGYRDVLILTLGTGIGGGLLLNGRLRRGPHGIGCEVGMVPFPDPVLPAVTAVESLASPRSVMRRLGQPDGDLYELAADGDESAALALEAMHHHLGWLVAVVHTTLDLQLVILSGVLASVGQALVDGVAGSFQAICPAELQLDLEITLGSLPHHAAGVVGAACLFLPG